MRKRLDAPFFTYFNRYTSIFSILLFLVFMIFVLPNQSLLSEQNGLLESPDTSLFYTKDMLYDIAESYGEPGRDFYIRQRFTFDLVWPLAYGLFLYVTSVTLFKNLQSKAQYKHMLVLPILAVMFDYLENISTSLVMYYYPNEIFLIPHLAGFFTSIKWITLSSAFIFLVLLVTLSIKQKIQPLKKKGSE